MFTIILIILMGGASAGAVYIFILSIRDLLADKSSAPTGATKVLYENDLDITLEMRTWGSYVDVQHVDSPYQLFEEIYGYHITKGHTTIDVPNVACTERVEKTGYELNRRNQHLATIRINKVTLVEMEHTSTLRIGKNFSKVLKRIVDNKVVIDYEVTNIDEIEQRIRENKRDTEILQQFVTPTKGDKQ
jgi:hypothetical protein